MLFQTIAVLAISASVMAHPHASRHRHHLKRLATGTGVAPTGGMYTMHNTTIACGPTGTGYGTGTGTGALPTMSATESAMDTGVGPGSGSASSPVGGSACAGSQSTTTVYSTDLVTVTVTAPDTAIVPTSMSIPDVIFYTSYNATATGAEQIETSSTTSYSATASEQSSAEENSSTAAEASSPASYASSAAAISSPVTSATSASAVEPSEVSSSSSTTMAPGGFYEVSETQASTTAPTSFAAPSVIPSVPATGSSGSGKRGLAYNSATLTNAFSSSSMSWAYNWANSPSGILAKGIEFVPMLWGEKMFGGWDAAAKSAIAAGAKNMLSFNEPDLAEQANMDTATAAAAHIKYMNPYAGSVRIGSPAVTNGGPTGGTDGMGLGWMQKFFDQCAGKCKVDFLAFHWYDSATNVAYFKNYVNDVIDMAKKNGVNKVWLTEFDAAGSEEQVANFLNEVLPWMDSNDAIERYSYFMCSEGKLVNGDALSAVGKAYAG